MAYIVKEIFYTLQGEGVQTGRPAVFCRFSGCNLWSGRERTVPVRTAGFVIPILWEPMVQAVESLTTRKNLRRAIAEVFPRDTSPGIALVVLTGGEPALQVDSDLIEALHEQ